MKALFEAIYSKYEGSPLSTALTGKLHTPKAPKGTNTPYGVYYSPGGHTRPGAFDHDVESVPVLFVFYVDSNEEAHDFNELCKVLFDNGDLIVEGYHVRKAERETPGHILPAGDAFKVMIQYRFELEVE
ncbi:MAG: hypothetical protein JEY79_13985 [Pseudodesulfovibrio sp.]|nr:hypothetical protein [Pseudodesulfovibrio sp.]